MKTLPILVVAAVSLTLGAPLAAASDRRQPVSKDGAEKKERASVFGKPIEARPEEKDKPRSPWGGLYGGMSGGGATTDR